MIRTILGWSYGLSRGLATQGAAPKTTVNLYAGAWPETFVSLSNLHDNPGATKQKRRVGRGTGSGRGKTCGRGHKGQKARSGAKPRLLFAGNVLHLIMELREVAA